MRDTTALNQRRALRGLPPIESVLHKMHPACKMRLVGPDNLKSFTRRFVIHQLEVEYEKA